MINKRTLLLFLLLPALAFIGSKPKKVIFFGDSITQAGIRPGGYISLMQEDLKSKGLVDQFELVGAGVSGNKVYDLFLRLEDDVLLQKPDIVIIYIGVNDVWHKSSSGTGTDANKFEGFYKALIAKMQKQGIEVILATPAVIGERYDHTNMQDGDLNFYSGIIKRLAQENTLKLIDLRTAFLAYSKEHNPENADKGILTTDRVHLNEKGNRMEPT